ncbi:hypothetical protein HOK31_24490 [Candidatus Poribacteria bacterium]|nr:hypothetical protein [Candidatus Poribacteria bacterium]
MRVRTHKNDRKKIDIGEEIDVTMKTADARAFMGQRRLRVRSIDENTGIPTCVLK